MSRYFNDCVDCEKRTPGCHSYCESYKHDKEKQLENKNRINKYNQANSDYIAYQMDRSNRRNKKRK